MPQTRDELAGLLGAAGPDPNTPADASQPYPQALVSPKDRGALAGFIGKLNVPSLSSVANGVANGATEAGKGMLDSAISGFTLPRDVYRGDVDLNSDEGFGRMLDTAGLAMGGSSPFSAPAGSLRTFGGRAAATADHAALDRAATMQHAGASPADIWRETGWGLNHDGILHFEIPDNAARIRPHDGSSSAMLGDILDHDQLYAAYPQLRDVKVFHRPEMGTGAAAWPKSGWMAADLNGPETLQALLHESSHFVQNYEGFAPGSSPGDPYVQALASGARDSNVSRARNNAYIRSAGEVEARNVETRLPMTEAERRMQLPEATEDVPRDRQWSPRSLAKMVGAGR